MFKNYLKIAWRNLVRRKGHAFINIGGLTIGIAVCLLIFSIVQFEMSFDNYHQKKNRIYRVLTEFHHKEVPEPFTGSGVPFPFPLAMKADIPQIESSAVLFSANESQFQVLNQDGNVIKKFKEDEGVLFTEPDLFDIFDFEWLAGNAASLSEPNNVVLSREIANKYFGNWERAMGKTIQANSTELLTVAGILENAPTNSDLQFKIVIAYGTGFTAQFSTMDDWGSIHSDFALYVLLPPNVSEASINSRLDLLAAENRADDNENTQLLQSLKEVHFDTQSGNFSHKSISYELINVLWIVAAFILLIACVNFVNLSTAQTVNRSKEIGVRKVLGSNKTHLKLQFLSETFLIVLISVVLAMVLAYMFMDYVGSILDLSLTLDSVNNLHLLFFLVFITLLVTLLAGFYPSIVLARYKVLDALKSKATKLGASGISLRRSLVVFQFVVAQALIIGTVIIVKQMDFFMNQPIGFDQDAVVNIPLPKDSLARTNLDFLRNELLALNGIENVSYSSNTPMDENRNHWTDFVYNNSTEGTDFYTLLKAADHNYLDTYKMPLVAGRKIKELKTNTEFLVNETLLKKLGITNPEEVLNKNIDLWDGTFTGPIVGVLKDFQDHSFKDEIAPVLMMNGENMYGQVGIKMRTDEGSETVIRIEKIWNRIFPNYVFEYRFLDDKIAGFYDQERRLSQLYKISAGIAILLSCLGLFGLASFMIMQRIKEAGIRKVLGATKNNIVFLFSKEFIVLVVIAFCIAAPIAWYFMNNWLAEYANRITITWVVFAIGGLTTLLIAMATVGYQAFKVASRNPIKSLRTE